MSDVFRLFKTRRFCGGSWKPEFVFCYMIFVDFDGYIKMNGKIDQGKMLYEDIQLHLHQRNKNIWWKQINSYTRLAVAQKEECSRHHHGQEGEMWLPCHLPWEAIECAECRIRWVCPEGSTIRKGLRRIDHGTKLPQKCEDTCSHNVMYKRGRKKLLWKQVKKQKMLKQKTVYSQQYNTIDKRTKT